MYILAILVLIGLSFDGEDTTNNKENIIQKNKDKRLVSLLKHIIILTIKLNVR